MQRTGKACRVVQTNGKGLRTRSYDVQGQKRWIPQLKKWERQFAFPPLFCSVGPSTDWMVPTHTGEGESSLLSLQIQKLISSGNISQTHSEIMFYQQSELLLVHSLTHKINHHNQWLKNVLLTGINDKHVCSMTYFWRDWPCQWKNSIKI